VVLGYCGAYYYHFGPGFGYFLWNTKEVSEVRVLFLRGPFAGRWCANVCVGPSKWLLELNRSTKSGELWRNGKMERCMFYCCCCSWIESLLNI
jgi:hypothetical protein